MSRGDPSYGAARPWTPLALTLGLHLLLVLAWLTLVRGAAPEPAPRASTLVLVQSLPRPAPQPDLPLPLPIPRTRLPDAVSAPGPVVAAPAVAPALEPEPVAEPQPDAAPAPAPPGGLLASAKAMAGRVDRELGKGSSAITAEPERKWERFADAFAAARTDDARTVTLDSHTSPDGVIIYRKTRGNRTSCYRSGSVGGLVTGFGNADLHGASIMTCPAGVRWTRH